MISMILISTAIADGLSPAEKVLLAVGAAMTIALIGLFVFIFRMAGRDDAGGPGDTRVKK